MHKRVDRRRLLVCLVACVILFVVTAMFAVSKNFSGPEQSVLFFFNHLPDSMLLAFLVMTQAGSEWMLFGVTLLLLSFKYNRMALRVFGVGTVTFLTSEVLKNIIARPRPGLLLHDVVVRERAFMDYGFPSSHTAVATAVSLIVVAVLPKRLRWVCVPWIALVGISRMYLGVHAPLDVVAGFAVGAIVVSLTLIVRGKLGFVRKITGLRLQR